MKNGDEPAFAAMNEQEIILGLTKREYFSGLAMQGILASIQGDLKFSFEEVLPKIAVMYADELLNQLEK